MAKQATAKVSVTALGQVRIFSPLTEEELTVLAENCSWSRHEAASEVLAQDAPCDEVYFICSGRVSAKTFSDAGKESPLRNSSKATSLVNSLRLMANRAPVLSSRLRKACWRRYRHVSLMSSSTRIPR